MDEKNIKPDLITGRKTLVITYFDPQLPQGGSSMLMRNLLLNFNPGSFEIISVKPRKPVTEPIFNADYLLTDVYARRRPLQWLLSRITASIDARRIQKKLNGMSSGAIFLVYPHLYNASVFLKLKLHANTKVVGYFHDTFVEGQLHRHRAKYLNSIHSRLLSSIETLFVMNEGMEKLYAEKYKYPAISLEHSYPEYDETIRQLNQENSYEIQDTAFWGGTVLGYNAESLGRLITAFEKAGLSFEIATKQKMESLTRILGNRNFKKTSYERKEYVVEVKKKKFLILALNWPDETQYHFDEISTIFSTKTIEYLLSGRPVVLHCPENYFMAKFFLKHKCGFVISQKDPAIVERELSRILSEDYGEILSNARNIASMFSPCRVLSKYKQAVSNS